MTHIEYTQALAFMTLCSEGSIRAAAEFLGIEPSTISRQFVACGPSKEVFDSPASDYPRLLLETAPWLDQYTQTISN